MANPFKIVLILCGALFAFATHAADWAPAHGPLMTRWTAEVTPANAHAEYPRPQLVRSNWLNLNGLWDYAITPPPKPAGVANNPTNGASSGPGSPTPIRSRGETPVDPAVPMRNMEPPVDSQMPSEFMGQILVPFPVESALSGVMRRFDENSTLWYRRSFEIPAAWAGSRVRLHFGAVDWRARVFVNGRLVATHRGGYDPFTVDLTGRLKTGAAQELVVAVEDPTEGDQPRGKQSRRPEGIFYTPSSGIWQTVWLEPVPASGSIDGLVAVPDLDNHCVRLTVSVNSLSDSLQVDAVAGSGDREVCRVAGPANKELRIPIDSPRLWTTDDPFLYDLRVTLRHDGREIDSVTSYFGMRKSSLRRDSLGITRLALNDEVLFQWGILDQGFWPDGIYTAPTDEALRSDIEFFKSAGFNLIRKHVKVEPDRWYYWCDKLGMLVWQDMPEGKNSTVEGRRQFETEVQRIVETLRNHPCITQWVLFNEGWGQYETERLTQWLRALDPYRLIDSASGWTDKRVGNLIDIHSYPMPDSPQPEAERAAALGEYGGLGWRMEGHSWSEQFWSYQLEPDPETRLARYSSLIKRVRAMRSNLGLSAAVLTQATDVETECNGLLTYDRIPKLHPQRLREWIGGETASPAPLVVAPNSLHGWVTWRYTTDEPAAGWMAPGFDASTWPQGTAGFGTGITPGAFPRTTWNTSDIWLRREFTIANNVPAGAKFQLFHDEDIDVYLNGVLAARKLGFVTDYIEVPINPEALAALHPGVNTIAVHCHQTTGGQFVDVGIIAGN